MSGTTLLLYSATTGHVLAAATVAESPSAEVKPESLAGKVIPIRYVSNPATNTLAVMQIPARDLAVLPIEAQKAPIGQIHTITVVNSKDKKLGTSSSVTATVATVASVPARTALKVAVPSASAVTEKTPGLVLIQPAIPSGSPEADILSIPFVIDAGKFEATLTVSAVPPSAPALVLVSGFAPSFTTIT
jgi:hypothetical protein